MSKEMNLDFDRQAKIFSKKTCHCRDAGNRNRNPVWIHIYQGLLCPREAGPGNKYRPIFSFYKYRLGRAHLFEPSEVLES
jgi:hypothetical protein